MNRCVLWYNQILSNAGDVDSIPGLEELVEEEMAAAIGYCLKNHATDMSET